MNVISLSWEITLNGCDTVLYRNDKSMRTNAWKLLEMTLGLHDILALPWLLSSSFETGQNGKQLDKKSCLDRDVYMEMRGDPTTP